ncbi:proline dehydrogenase [Fusarium bulbicola]|uniref:Proline dehydrogenase n=1 Tax=Gibberella subglutinans TaxID=42677 RepID=A0A8H5QC01_GIBSU|nr:proline dehydrogenase [Fusarium subglutinans]KAF5611707.1 proline dehydrogenase [Fusarium subglutinans]KAF5970487.1 proline dehydrogenase [Fusarium bulbicola]
MSSALRRGTAQPLRWATASNAIAINTLRPCLTITKTNMVARRHIHSSERRTNTIVEQQQIPDPLPPIAPSKAPLSVLPLIMILRSLATMTVSSSPLLLPPSLHVMGILANTTNPLLNPDKNPLLRYFLKKTFYAQFCAGEKSPEIKKTIDGLKNIGFTGVILNYAKEVVLTKDEGEGLKNGAMETDECIQNEILPWARGTLETVRLAEPGDFVALKFTGAGSIALYQLKDRLPPSPAMYKAIDSICQLAHERGVRLLFDAEQDMLQDGIDDWTLEFTRKYNKGLGEAVIFGTYQAYKKKCPEVLSNHLKHAQVENFALGVKLVRGAYLNSDPRELFHDTKEETDACFDSLAASVLTREWNIDVKGSGEYPAASLVVASHNAESVRRSRAIMEAGRAKSDIAFAQLQGMADEVSCELVEAGQSDKTKILPAYKYLVWGTTGECMKYLLRRAHENKDAVQRTRGSRDALWAELVRRCKSAVGLA